MTSTWLTCETDAARFPPTAYHEGPSMPDPTTEPARVGSGEQAPPGDPSATPIRITQPPLPTESAVGTPAPQPPSVDEMVTIVIDGREVQTKKGRWIITAADEAGVYIPRFC